jgi:hypothetical protein
LVLDLLDDLGRVVAFDLGVFIRDVNLGQHRSLHERSDMRVDDGRPNRMRDHDGPAYRCAHAGLHLLAMFMTSS